MANPKRRLKEIEEKAKEEISKVPGATLLSVEIRNHLRITLSLGGKQGSVHGSATPSDHRADVNLMGHIRRKLRELQEATNSC